MGAKPLSILIVDDENDICDLGRFYFEAAGYTVLTTDSPQGALEHLQTSPIHAILTDLRMPKGSGTEIFDMLSAQQTKPLVYLMSGFSEISDKTLRDMGAQRIFNKPFDWPRLVETIHGDLEKLNP